MPVPLPRPAYAAIFQSLLDTPPVKVLTGVCAAGNPIASAGLREGVTEDGIRILSIIPWLLGRYDTRWSPCGSHRGSGRSTI